MMVLIVTFASIRQLWLVPVMISITAFIFLMSRLPLKFLIARLHYPGWFLLAILLLMPLTTGQTILWQWGDIALRREGLLAMLLIVSRFLCILTLGLVLLGTTPFLTLVQSLRSLRLSPILTDMLLLTYRYLFEIGKTVTTMQRSMQLRGFQPQRSYHPQLLWRWASLIGTLLVRSYEQSERVYKAMRLRGYGSTATSGGAGKTNSIQTGGWRWSQIGLGGVVLVAIALMIANSRSR
jgi:cobalt/nickel transport system permease protein